MVFSSIKARMAGFLLLAVAATVASPHTAAAFDDASRQEIGQIIREYLLANPELMLEVQDALEKKQKAQQVASQQKALSEQKEAIYSAAHQIEIGKPDAPITIVEFFDYNCGFCQRAISDMNRLVESGNVRFVLKDYPILSPQSLEAAKVSIAFDTMLPEKAGEFHRKLLGSDGVKDAKVALDVAVSLGADRDDLLAASKQPEVLETIRQTHQLAEALGISGTPSYVLGDEVVYGAVGFDDLNQKVANLGSCGKATC